MSWKHSEKSKPRPFEIREGSGTRKFQFAQSLAHPANDSVNGNWTYAYDAFNRLASANATGQAYTYAYDRFGNRWQQNGAHSSQPGFDANNHMTPGLGVTYDAAGDTTNDGSLAYTYDAEGRIATAGSSYTYTYDADGMRVRKASSGSIVDFLYDTEGDEIAQVSSTGTWMRGEIYGDGRHWATLNNGATYYNEEDWLGTERARSLLGATASCETVTSLPYGDWMTTTGSCGDPSPMHFTGKEHDSESGLDNFGARYDSSQYGRFMTPDPLRASGIGTYPQSWNRYIYGLDNPLRFIDPSGLAPCIPGANFACIGSSDPAEVQNKAETQELKQNTTQTQAQQQNPNNEAVGQTTVGSLSKVLTNEIGSLSTPKGGDSKELENGSTALANALINNADKKRPNGVAPDTGTASPSLATAMQDAYTNRANGGADPVQGRTFYGTSHITPDRLHSRPIGNGRQTVFQHFGPFKDSTSRLPTYIYIYNDPGH